MKKRLSVRIPASSANLGPGFDALALAYKLYCNLTFELSENGASAAPSVSVTGSETAGLPQSQDNLVLRVLSEHFPALKPQFKNLRVTIDSEIPLARGLGSSAACIAGTVFAGLYLSESESGSGQNPCKQAAFQLAARIEGHPDNVAASLFGGLTSSGRNRETRQFVAASVDWPENWRPILVVPDREVSTAHARSVLPGSVSMADAVMNIQNTALLLMAIQKKDRELLKSGLADCLHEPHRQHLVPELLEVKDLLRQSPALGVVLSGAGSSILVLCEARHVEYVKQELDKWASRGQKAKVMSLEVDREGLIASHEHE